MTRVARRRAAQHDALVAFVRDFLAPYGPTSDTVFPGEAWTVETTLGALRVHPIDDWIACRWEDLEAAKRVLPHEFRYDRLNPYSGKWNFHEGIDSPAPETFRRFARELQPFLRPIPVLEETHV